MFEVHLSTKAKKELDRINRAYRERIKEILKLLSADPVPTRCFDIKKLVGVENTYRIRIGKIRIVYSIIWEDKVVLISRISFRGRVY